MGSRGEAENSLSPSSGIVQPDEKIEDRHTRDESELDEERPGAGSSASSDPARGWLSPRPALSLACLWPATPLVTLSTFHVGSQSCRCSGCDRAVPVPVSTERD